MQSKFDIATIKYLITMEISCNGSYEELNKYIKILHVKLILEDNWYIFHPALFYVVLSILILLNIKKD